MTLRAAAALSVILLAACREDPVTPKPPPPTASAAATAAPTDTATAPLPAPPPPAPPPPLTVTPSQTIVLWTRSQSTRLAPKRIDTTHLLRADGTVAGDRPGVHMAVGDRLYHFDPRPKKAPGEKCEDHPNPYGLSELDSAALVPDQRGAAITLRDYARPDGNGSIAHTDHHHPVAILPGVVFVKGQGVYYPCGMHGMWGADFSAIFVRADGTTEIAAPADLAEGAAAGIARAAERLNEDVVPGTSPSSPDAPARPDQVTVSMAYPGFDAFGLAWRVLYTTDASWARSRGGWAGYTRSVELPIPGVPARFRAAAALPDAVRAYAAAHPDDEVRGFSIGELGAAR